MLVDTSAWIEYLRGTGSTAHVALRDALVDGRATTTDAVVLEVLSGESQPSRVERVRSLLARCAYLRQEPMVDAESAAAVFRQCRWAGETPRSQLDCLIAAVAIRHDVPVLHRDRDFDVLARHTPLRVVAT